MKKKSGYEQNPRPRSNRLADELGQYGGHTWVFAFLQLERLLYHQFSADLGSLDGCRCFKLCFAIHVIDNKHSSVTEAVLYGVLCVMFHSHSDEIADKIDGMLQFILFPISYYSLMALFKDGMKKMFVNDEVRKKKKNKENYNAQACTKFGHIS